MQCQEAKYISITEIDEMLGDEDESSNTNSESEQTGTNTTQDCRSRSTSLEIIEKYDPRLAKDKIGEHGSAGSNSIQDVMQISKLEYTQAQDTLIFLRFQQLQKMSLETGGPGCGLDPFNNLGLSSDRNTHVAIDHWTSGVQKTRTPMSPRPAWFRTSIADPVILAATVAASTSHLLYCQGAVKSTPAYISHKVRAIQAINKNLDSPESASDYTIMAVAMMAIIEGLAGGPAACAIHRQGLGQLVRSRGGLKTLGLNGIAARTVSW
ncbi:hypothetical protein B0O99DRAFT_595408 [Bisporella sp. PMI_857]|nr:hypothetical protein B0O99DRAFT_595408 [Bisporella sp. PMI_857]